MSPPPTPKIHRKHYGPRATMNRDELDQARRIVTYDSRAVVNYSEALVGEVVARDWVTSAYKGKAKLRAVMIRPGGVPLLDYLFETGNGEFVVVEAKASKSQLGWTKGRILMIEPGGGAYFLEIPRDVQQFSPTWFDQRLAEMRGPKGDPASRRLAAELDASWRAGKVRALVIRAPEGVHTTEVAMEVFDHSDEWNAHIGAASNHTIPKGSEVGSVVNGAPIRKGVEEQRPAAERILKVHQAEKNRLEKKLGLLDKAKTKANAELRRAQGRLKTAEKKQTDAGKKAGTRQLTKDKITAKIKAERQEVARLESKASEAQQAVDDIKRRLDEVHQRIKDARADLRQMRSTSALPGKQLSLEASKVNAVDPQAVKASRAVETQTARAVGSIELGAKKDFKAVESLATSGKATETAHEATQARIVQGDRSVRKLVVAGADAAKVGKLARVLSLTKNVGKIAIGLFVPLTKLEILLELALWLYDWDQQRRKAEEREWRRLYDFLFNYATPISDPFSISYLPAIGGNIWNDMNTRLNNERDPRSLIYWVREWDRNPKWLGFVYVGVVGDLIRQEHVPRQKSANRAPYPIRYWSSELKLDFKTWSRENNRWKKEGLTRELQPQDPDNLFTLGTFGDPFSKPENEGPTPSIAAGELRNDYLCRDVESRRVSVHVTSPTPIITPFDYLTYKCKDLMTEILRFIWRFDEYFHVMAPFNRETFFLQYWYEGVKFAEPIDSDSAHYCLKKLHAFIMKLETHTPQPNESAQAGWERRLKIITSMVLPNRTRNDLSDIAQRLHFLASDLNYAAYRPVQDPDLAYLTNEYLSELASDILKSARRIYTDMMSGKDSPRSFEYRYLGSKDI